MEKNIYEMKLHEVIEILIDEYGAGRVSCQVLRVPGGWIYSIYSLKHGNSSTKFIPYNNEFLTTN